MLKRGNAFVAALVDRCHGTTALTWKDIDGRLVLGLAAPELDVCATDRRLVLSYRGSCCSESATSVGTRYPDVPIALTVGAPFQQRQPLGTADFPSCPANHSCHGCTFRSRHRLAMATPSLQVSRYLRSMPFGLPYSNGRATVLWPCPGTMAVLQTNVSAPPPRIQSHPNTLRPSSLTQK